MPKQTVSINETPNPTGLSMDERRFAMDVIRSLEASVKKERDFLLVSRYTRSLWTAEDEQQLRARVYKSAYNQLTGRQKTEQGSFKLTTTVPVADQDMEYVLRSLGVS